jgi:hypothetical protein
VPGNKNALNATPATAAQLNSLFFVTGLIFMVYFQL